MRRSDEEHDFITDSMEKKRTARGAHNKVTHGGRVRFPADYMSKKELKAMSGEVQRYNLNKPMKWVDFKRMPDDLKKEYLLKLRDQFNAADGDIGAMMGCDRKTIGKVSAKLNISVGKAPHRARLKKAEWAAFCGIKLEKEGGVEMEKEKETQKPKIEQEMILRKISDFPVPKSGSLIFEGKANDALRTIQQLLQNENVRLSVMWEKIDSGVESDG